MPLLSVLALLSLVLFFLGDSRDSFFFSEAGELFVCRHLLYYSWALKDRLSAMSSPMLSF